MHRKLLMRISLLTGVIFCSSCKKYSLTQYSENLSCHRMQLSITNTVESLQLQENTLSDSKEDFFKDTTTTGSVTQQLHELLLGLKDYYAMTKFIAGYTIQVYVGVDRQLAIEVKEKVSELYPQFHTDLQYKSPNFIVTIGRFLDRLDAFELYSVVTKDFSQAIMRPARFPNKINIIDYIPKNTYPNNSLQFVENG